jgi:hypothetical protein
MRKEPPTPPEWLTCRGVIGYLGWADVMVATLPYQTLPGLSCTFRGTCATPLSGSNPFGNHGGPTFVSSFDTVKHIE